MDGCITVFQAVLMAIVPFLAMTTVCVFLINLWSKISQKYIDSERRNIILSHTIEQMEIMRAAAEGK